VLLIVPEFVPQVPFRNYWMVLNSGTIAGMGSGVVRPQGGVELGYARVSAARESLARQLDALSAEGIGDERIYTDSKTGTLERAGLTQLLGDAQAGDTIVVHTIDRLGRNLREVLGLLRDLAGRGIGVRSLADPLPIDTTDEGVGRVAFGMLTLFAEMERTYIAERAAHARSVAGAHSRHVGRPIAHPADTIEYARLLRGQGESYGEISAKTNIPKASLHRYLAPPPRQDSARPAAPGARGASGARYQSRPGRRALVAASLADLRGPAEGTVELPLRLFWSSPDRRFDLGKPFMLRSLYETVLREASRPEDLTTYLNGDTLLAVWPDLYLPRGVRQAWEDEHPGLHAAPAAVA
jgi:DNA invertase Pin-like site-specific DNA recombinase